MYAIVTDIITSEYQKRFKEQNFKNQLGGSKAMVVSFKTSMDYDVEDGYRFLDILLYNQGNYVSVFARTRWTVIRSEWLEEDGFVEGKDYIEGTSEWIHVVNHDSCWRDGVRRIMRLFRDSINVIDSLCDWYKTQDLTEDDIREFRRIEEASNQNLVALEEQFAKKTFKFSKDHE